LLERETEVAEPAGALKVTVPRAFVPPLTVVGLSDNDDTDGVGAAG
jgi:hypothetical protein